MMTKRMWFPLVLLVPLGAAVVYSQGKQEGKPADASAAKDDPMLMKFKEYGTPGPNHKVLDPKVGKWTAEATCYMKQGDQPEKSKGSSEAKWVYGGRFLQESFTGDHMGEAFQGTGTTGYDNIKKKYVCTWYDSMGTGIPAFEGTYDAASKTFNFAGECPDPVTGKYVKSRIVEKWTDNDHFTHQHFAPGADGKEFMNGEISYTRVK